MESLRIKHNQEQHELGKSSLMTNIDIKNIEERCNKIKSEKWEMCKVEVGNVSFYDVVMNEDHPRPFTKQECEFIVNARVDIPKLLQHINALQKLLHQYQQNHEECSNY